MKVKKKLITATIHAVKFCVLVSSGLISSALNARTLEPAPDIDSWITEVRNAPLPPQTVPQRLLLLESSVDDKNEVNLITDSSEIGKISPFFLIDGPSAELSVKLNRKSKGGKVKAQKALAPSISSANVIIAGIRRESASIYTNDGRDLRKVGVVKPYSGDKSAESVLTWIYQSFGYDGIILGRKGAYVIVGGPSSVFRKERIQALAIRGSESQLALLDKKRSGVSLLELQSSKGPYAIFKILALAKGSTELPIATKLTIQRDFKNN